MRFLFWCTRRLLPCYERMGAMGFGRFTGAVQRAEFIAQVRPEIVLAVPSRSEFLV